MIIITDDEGKQEYQKDAANYLGKADKVYLPETTDPL